MSAMLLVLPDAEALVVALLKSAPELASLGGRIYTTFPSQAGSDPLVIVSRYGGTVAVARPFVLDVARVQLSVYGGTKAQASSLVRLIAALISQSPTWPVDVDANGIGPRSLPDETYRPPRPRFLLDTVVYLRPTASGAASSSVDARRPQPAPMPGRG